MTSMVVKLKQTNYLAIFLVLLLILWQGYGYYQSKMIGVNTDTYIYTKVISNVIPAAIAEGQNTEVSLWSQLVYSLTEVDLGDYRSLLEKNIPLLRQEILLGSSGDYKPMGGFHKLKAKKDPSSSEDYFDPSQELLITEFEEAINPGKAVSLDQLKDDSYVTSKLINFDANLNQKGQAMRQVDTMKLVEKQFKINTQTEGPKVIIFHTHPHERFADEEPSGGGVVDVGSYLKEILESQYGVETLHCTNRFEKTANNAGKDDYGRMQIEVKKILAENPSIEVAIDIHRDGISGNKKFLTNINGKETAKLMFVNGFCQVQKKGVLTPITSLPNPYLEDNMALALQLQLKAIEKYPDYTRKTLVKPYRYSLHMKPMSLLLEIGNQNNTKEEALNTIEVFADLLMDVIEKD